MRYTCDCCGVMIKCDCCDKPATRLDREGKRYCTDCSRLRREEFGDKRYHEDEEAEHGSDDDD